MKVCLNKALFLPLISSLLVAMPTAADSSGPRLAAYYDRFLALAVIAYLNGKALILQLNA
ncbi:hypothetical protein [uncultured Psychromonas sp.]|uniref:hypothetical protein n=1 Tax=uncultured Psychromonas sp. TaxID=173974 RepID=UPI0026275571|nr:hypothetical protein [uncultured Psychromonas sp.]